MRNLNTIVQVISEQWCFENSKFYKECMEMMANNWLVIKISSASLAKSSLGSPWPACRASLGKSTPSHSVASEPGDPQWTWSSSVSCRRNVESSSSHCSLPSWTSPKLLTWWAEAGFSRSSRRLVALQSSWRSSPPSTRTCRVRSASMGPPPMPSQSAVK